MAWCIGPCLLIDKKTWLRAGSPRSDMLAFGDDVEFSLRLSAAFPAWAEPSVTVIHAPPTASSPPSVGPRSAGATNPKLSAQSLESPPPAAPRPPSEAAPPQWSAAKEGRHPPPATSHPLPDAAHYRKFGTLLQNLAFTCVISPRPRHLPLYLPGNARRFLRTFGFTPANFLEVLHRYLKGFLGIPGGR
jgi:hypothetical protein